MQCQHVTCIEEVQCSKLLLAVYSCTLETIIAIKINFCTLVKSYNVTHTYIIIICNQAVTTLQVDSADCQRGHSFVTSGTYCP